MFDRARGLRGLVNLGNTCFAAACLQSLAHTPPLAEFVLRESPEESASARGTSEVAREFARVVRAIHKSDALTSSRDAHDPRAFVRALDARPPLDLFTDGDQHDSQEFLRFLLDALDEDLNAVTTPPPYSEEKDDFSEPESAKAARLWAKYRARTSGVVVDVFAGQLRSAVTCHACGKASTSYDPFWDLSLPLRARRRREEDASSSSSSTTMRRSGSASLLSRYMGVGRSERSGSSGALSVTEKNAPGVFSQRVDASRALCPYDLRGLCHDPKCPWQSRDDYVLTREERKAAHDVFSRSNGRVRSGGDVFSVRSVITPHEKYPECLALRSINFDAKPLRRHATTRRRKWLLSSQGKDPPEVKTPLYNSPSVARLEGRGIGCVVRSVVARVGEEPPELATRGYRYFN